MNSVNKLQASFAVPTIWNESQYWKALCLCILFVFISGCDLLGSYQTAAPEIRMEPSSVPVGQDITITISSTEEFIMPFCGGITYVIEKRVSDRWEFFDWQVGPCTADRLPETWPSKSHTVVLTIDEQGTYRFISSYKFKREDKFEALYSDEFFVGEKGVGLL